MFDEITFNTRHPTEAAEDPLLAMLKERARLHQLAARAQSAGEEIELELPDDVQLGVVKVKLPDGDCSCRTEEDVNRSVSVRVRLVETFAKYGSDVDRDYLREWSEGALEQYRAGKAAIEAAREASGCAAAYRQAETLRDMADELQDRICETQAISLAGVLGQLALLRDDDGGIDDQLIDSIVAGVKALVPAER
jgi:hypothetical protein